MNSRGVSKGVINIFYNNNSKMKKSQEENKGFSVILLNNKKYILDNETDEVFEILSDKSSRGRKRPWRTHKIENQSVEECYKRLASDSSEPEREYWLRRASRLHDCGVHLWFNVYSDENGGEMMRIKHAESCRVRLCPLCTWRRSIKIQTHTRKILEQMQSEKKYEYILVTFTVPSITGEELLDKISDMMGAWDRFQHYVKFKKAVKGWYRGLEVTHNLQEYKFGYVKKNGKKQRVTLVDDSGEPILNPFYDTYHPHFHCIFAVSSSYFNSRDYIKRDEWLAMWQKAMKDPTITQVDVRKVKPKKIDNTEGNSADMIISAVCEVAKYTVKTGDYVLPWNWNMSCKSIKILDKALANRRLVAYGGVMKDWHKKLNLDDEIDGNLIEEGETPNGEVIREVCAFWNVGYQQYVIVDENIKNDS